MSELEKWSSSGRALSRNQESRKYDQAVDRVKQEARLAKLEQDATAALAVNGMDLMADIDKTRLHHQQQNPELAPVLAEIEMAAAEKFRRGILRFGE